MTNEEPATDAVKAKTEVQKPNPDNLKWSVEQDDAMDRFDPYLD